jgi:hypothetical protein
VLHALGPTGCRRAAIGIDDVFEHSKTVLAATRSSSQTALAWG